MLGVGIVRQVGGCALAFRQGWRSRHNLLEKVLSAHSKSWMWLPGGGGAHPLSKSFAVTDRAKGTQRFSKTTNRLAAQKAC